MVFGKNKKKCKFKTDGDGNYVKENGRKVLMCKTEGGDGPVVAHPKQKGGYNYVPEGSIGDDDEKKVITYMKMRLGRTEGKDGEF